ncbi:hypothetical protein Gotri_016880 [Gossypium trilobum]|uniref:peroxidase n=1 Tax=Gossypium trilobum TaxID=34281 RepID=A0A7J9E4S7_9ROSI|nr:hypothetical protein [Gossypium trilobum]
MLLRPMWKLAAATSTSMEIIAVTGEIQTRKKRDGDILSTMIHIKSSVYVLADAVWEAFGRKDSLESNISSVEANIPRANTTMDEIIRMFESKNFTVGEMVALSGAHTIGFSHCKEFAYRLFGYSRSTPTDPSYHPKFSAALKTLCANYKNDSDMAAFNDPMTPSKFDNMYYQNLKRGMGLLESDNGLLRHPRTKHFVDLYAFNQTAFSNDFARAIEKLSLSGIKTGNQGEVRRKCDAFNTFQT